jgi:hypothetical protein
MDDSARTSHPPEMQASRVGRNGDGVFFEEDREGEVMKMTAKDGQGE